MIDLAAIRMPLKAKIIDREQRLWSKPGRVYTCPWCEKPGGDYNGGGDLHEWFFKRGSNAPLEVLYSPQNCVVVHYHCHKQHGQTKDFKAKMYEHKSKFYNIEEWLASLLKEGRISHRPDMNF